MIAYPTSRQAPAIQITGRRPEKRTAQQRFSLQGSLRSTILNSKQNTQFRLHFFKYLAGHLAKQS